MILIIDNVLPNIKPGSCQKSERIFRKFVIVIDNGQNGFYIAR